MLADSVLSVMFNLLVTAQQNDPNLVISDLKLIYHSMFITCMHACTRAHTHTGHYKFYFLHTVTNILLRVDGISDDGHSISDESMLVQYGIQLLITTLRHQTPSSQSKGLIMRVHALCLFPPNSVTQLLLNNQPLLQKLSSFLPQNKNAKV